MPIWRSQILGIFSISRFGIVSPTKILCTKIHIHNKFPVDTSGHWCKIITLNMPNLSLKIFRRSTVLKLVLKFQIKFGDPRPSSISILWPISKITKILAPENARGPEHFKSCVILGHPIENEHFYVKSAHISVFYSNIRGFHVKVKIWKNE